MSPRPANPYVVGQWVRGDRFYGRHAQLAEILDGPRDRLWLVGTRRAGKTSLLKQLEAEAAAADAQYVPVFWDLQGADTAEELALTFHDGLLDAQERFAEVGLPVDGVAPSFLDAITEVRLQLGTRGLRMLLLCDEVEELIGLAREEPGCVDEVATALGGDAALRVVLCSSPRLNGLSATPAGAALLGAFGTPRFLSRLTPEESRALIRQDKLPPEQRPVMDGGTVEEIRRRCGDHPYLMQLLCRRTVELGGLDRACEVVAGDRMVSHFIAVDLGMLEDAERELLAEAATGEVLDAGPSEFTKPSTAAVQRPSLRLESLGLLRRGANGYEVANDFLRHHLLGARS